jgi:MFS family permease
VFWYGIEKLFMQSIGLDAVSVGMLTVLTIVLNLALDIPSGILADKWSRKGMLVVSAFALAICSLLLGSSTGFATYAIGYALYSLYVVCTSGTYQAITYDSLHEEGESKFYSKVMGRAYALFLCGAGVANIASGFIADNFGYRMPFYLTVLSCLVNMAVMLSLKEPAFHKPENKEKILRQLIKTSKAVLVIPLLRILAIIMSLFAIVELFKADFGQLYFLRYVTEPQLLGLLWAVYAFTWAIGGFIAHRLHNRLNELVIGATLPVLLMGFIDSWPALVLFNVQAVASAALMNQIETRVQDETPSHVRASIISVLSSIGRAVTIPASLALGWIFKNQGAFVAVRAMSILATCILIIWIFYQYSSKKKAVI